MSDPRTQEHEAAAEKADWWQVISNGGPPCFYLQTDPKFVTGPQYCLRAERWEGHRNACMHPYVTLGMLVSGFAAALADAVRVARAEEREACARLHENIDPACDHERLAGNPGSAAMGAIVKYRDAIRGRSKWADRKRVGEGDATPGPEPVKCLQCGDVESALAHRGTQSHRFAWSRATPPKKGRD